jgi:GNAT superfamily N-acetyltransferase
MSNTIREGGPADFVEVDALREAIEWPPGTWFTAPVLDAGGVLPLIRDEDGLLIAMGLGGHFGRGGFVGNMVVHPGRQRQGLGTKIFRYLMDWFAARGVRTVQLEATPEGQPLYERFGFRARWESVTGVCQAPPDRDGTGTVSSASEADWPAIAALAGRAYGEGRDRLLQSLAALPETVETAVLKDRGRVVAFALRREGRLGPFCAEDDATAEDLARTLLRRAGPGTRVAIGNPLHSDFWTALGVEIEPNDVRMWFGDEPADEPAMLYAMLNGGIG